VNRAQREELAYKQRLKQAVKRGEISVEEHDAALAIERAAEVPTSSASRCAALGVGVMDMYMAFLRTPEMRAALEEFARANYQSLWSAFDAACARELDCTPWDYINFRIDEGTELAVALAEGR